MATVQFDLYFYHPDHLSSSSWITDISGTAIQHLQYLPFGETRVDQRTTIWNSRYSFSAKEKDEESGYGYFGARYYDSDLSIWLSVDPMSDKYPGLSPYNYCANNPVKLVDPNGMEIYEFDESGKYLGKSGEKGTPDQIQIRKIDGSTVASNEYTNGTITEGFTKSVKQKNGSSVDAMFLQVIGDKNAKESFEFVADNTGVEWGSTSVGTESGDKGINYLSNSQEQSHESSGQHAIMQAVSNNSSIRGYTHNHHESPWPSGADRTAAKQLHTKFPNAIMNTYVKGGGYFQYDSGGIINQDDRVRAGMFDISKWKW